MSTKATKAPRWEHQGIKKLLLSQAAICPPSIRNERRSLNDHNPGARETCTQLPNDQHDKLPNQWRHKSMGKHDPLGCHRGSQCSQGDDQSSHPECYRRWHGRLDDKHQRSMEQKVHVQEAMHEIVLLGSSEAPIQNPQLQRNIRFPNEHWHLLQTNLATMRVVASDGHSMCSKTLSVFHGHGLDGEHEQPQWPNEYHLLSTSGSWHWAGKGQGGHLETESPLSHFQPERNVESILGFLHVHWMHGTQTHGKPVVLRELLVSRFLDGDNVISGISKLLHQAQLSSTSDGWVCAPFIHSCHDICSRNLQGQKLLGGFFRGCNGGSASELGTGLTQWLTVRWCRISKAGSPARKNGKLQIHWQALRSEGSFNHVFQVPFMGSMLGNLVCKFIPKVSNMCIGALIVTMACPNPCCRMWPSERRSACQEGSRTLRHPPADIQMKYNQRRNGMRDGLPWKLFRKSVLVGWPKQVPM